MNYLKILNKFLFFVFLLMVGVVGGAIISNTNHYNSTRFSEYKNICENSIQNISEKMDIVSSVNEDLQNELLKCFMVSDNYYKSLKRRVDDCNYELDEMLYEAQRLEEELNKLKEKYNEKIKINSK